MLNKYLNLKRVQRLWKSFQVTLLRNSGYFALLSFTMCLFIVTSKSKYRPIHEVNDEFHYDFHRWQATESDIAFHEDTHGGIVTEISEKSTKLILFWTKYHGSSTYDFGLGGKPFESALCPINRCMTTTDRTLLNESHAIIFHVMDLNATDLPRDRLPHQRWIFYTFTSPSNTPKLPYSLKDKFNWTMTYRQDSDIFHRYPYGAMRARNTLRLNFGKKKMKSVSFQSSLLHKRKLIAFFSSNCQTNVEREKYVEELNKFIPVDHYGNCGKFKCGEVHSCLQMLQKEYKFLLAFENSLCPDYVTEKLYLAFDNYVVPVVYGGADYSLYAPAHSYINARDFASPRLLADYLWTLHRNEPLYRSYFHWKLDYEVDRFPKDGWCHLCKMLHAPLQYQTYSDIYKWWHGEPSCEANYIVNITVSR